MTCFHAKRILHVSNHYFTLGVIKLNDVCRRIHLEKSNKWDATKDVLLVEERLQHLSDLQRTPRPYNKVSEYWKSEIHEDWRKRPRLCNQEQPDDSMEDISLLTCEVLQLRLKGLGIKTRVRNVTRLQDMYHIALQSKK